MVRSLRIYRETFNRGDFKVVLDLCTQDIDSNSAIAKLYTGHALILFKLGRKTGMHPQYSSVSCAENVMGIDIIREL